MADQEFYHYLDDLQAQPKARRWWPKALAICATLGGVYGATLGVTIGAVPGTATIIEIAAAIFAFLCSGPGAWYGSIFGIINRICFGRYFVGMAAAIRRNRGRVLGDNAPDGLRCDLGGRVGGFVARAIARRGPSIRLLSGLVGVVLRTFIGVVLWAVNLNQPKALVGLAWGLGIGAVVGPLLLLIFVGR